MDSLVSISRDVKVFNDVTLENNFSNGVVFAFCVVNVYHGAAKEEAFKVKEILANIPNVQEIFFGQISPAMVVHTVPGLVGVSIHEI